MTRRRYSPAPGTDRCLLCGQPDDSTHVPHPIADQLIWLWKAHRAWRVILILAVVTALMCLTAVIIAIREALNL